MSALVDIAMAARDTLLDMAPYLLFGFFAAGLLSVVISPRFVERQLGGNGLLPILKASLFGVPLPLCSCSVIPVGASLRRHGSSRGATAAFLLSTPQTGVDSIVVTFSMLGPVFAIFRPVAAFVSGVIGGSAVEWLGDGGANEAPAPQCEEACCHPTHAESTVRRVLNYAFVVLPRDLAKPLLVGLLVAGAVSAWVPSGYLPEHVGAGLPMMLAMLLMGIPVYICATASIPIAAALMVKGVSPGAVLVLLMTGPATNAATIATVWKTLGRRAGVAYLGAVAITALAAGLLLDVVMGSTPPTTAVSEAWMLPGWAKLGAAVVLLGVLGWATVGPRKPHSHAADIEQSEETG